MSGEFPAVLVPTLAAMRRGLAPAALRRLAVTLAASLAGGLLAGRMGLPIPWLVGPILATAALVLAGREVDGLGAVRSPFVGIIGVMLGTSFSPQIFGQIADWWVLFLGLIGSAVTGAALAYVILRRLGGLDRATAYFGAMPGGLVEMSLMSEMFGGRMQSAFMIHTLRVSLVALLLPQFLIHVAGVAIPDSLTPGAQAAVLDPAGAAWLALCVFGGIPLARLLRFQAPELLGPMLLSALVHSLGVADFGMPLTLLTAAQVVIGINMGARFRTMDRASLARLGLVTLVLVTAHLGCAITAAVLMARLTGQAFTDLVVAYAPGGIAEMSIITLAVGGNVALVAVHHLVRVSLVLFLAPQFHIRVMGGMPEKGNGKDKP